ncbi:MAG TPA: TonB family protein [Candidatus Aquilonibacter sp.]|nr:TonB family protein [Candidatus Aquilonibacter sp.]
MNFKIVALTLLLAASHAGLAYGQDQTPAPAAPEKPPRIRVGGSVTQAKIISRVTPIYPAIARMAQVQGTVVLHAVIAKDGSVQSLELVSGPPMLVQAAIDAVKQWRYEPTLLAGKPVEVDTTVQVVFTLGDNPSPPEEQPVDPQFRADILHLFDVMHVQAKVTETAQALVEKVRPLILAELPPTPSHDKILDAYEKKLQDSLSSQELVDRWVAVYAKYLSDADVKAASEFYESPAGQRFSGAAQSLALEMAQIEEKSLQENLPKIVKGLCQEYPELQGTATFCPAPAPQDNKTL